MDSCCPTGWSFFNNQCYKPICPPGGIKYADAKAACIADGGNLAMPQDIDTHNWVWNLHFASKNGNHGAYPNNSPAWIDITDIAQEGTVESNLCLYRPIFRYQN